MWALQRAGSWGNLKWTERCLFGLSILASCAVLPKPGKAQTGSSFTVEDIRSAWRLREEQTPCLKLSWHTREFTPKGAIVSEKMRGKTPLPAPDPPTDREAEYLRSLLVDKGRMRFTERGNYWDDRSKRYAPAEYTIVWDAKEGRALDRFLEEGGHLEGRIVNTAAEVAVVTASPPLVAIWPLDPNLGGLRIEDYRVTNRRAEIDGYSCTLLRKVSNDTFRNEIWVDPQRDYLILRIDSRDGNFVRIRLDLKYQRDPQGGFYPAWWRRVTMKGPTAIRRSAESTVTDYSFTPEVLAADFGLEFPVGCFFSDQRGRTPVRYLVLPGGKNRLVLEEEWASGVPIKTLFKTEPGEALGQGSPSVPIIGETTAS